MSETSNEVLKERVDQLLRGQEKQEAQTDKVVEALKDMRDSVHDLSMRLVTVPQTVKDEIRLEMKTGYVTKQEYHPISKGKDMIVRSIIGVVVTAIAVAIGIQTKK